MPAAITALVASGELVDISYGNDAMPSFIARKHEARVDAEGNAENVPVLFVDYADPAKREDSGGTRFTVARPACGWENLFTEDLALALSEVGADKTMPAPGAITFTSLSREDLEAELRRCNDQMVRDGKTLGEYRSALEHLAKYGKQCDVKFIASQAIAKGGAK